MKPILDFKFLSLRIGKRLRISNLVAFNKGAR